MRYETRRSAKRRQADEAIVLTLEQLDELWLSIWVNHSTDSEELIHFKDAAAILSSLDERAKTETLHLSDAWELEDISRSYPGTGWDRVHDLLGDYRYEAKLKQQTEISLARISAIPKERLAEVAKAMAKLIEDWEAADAELEARIDKVRTWKPGSLSTDEVWERKTAIELLRNQQQEKLDELDAAMEKLIS